MMLRLFVSVICLSLALPAHAWDWRGHHAVGTIAQSLLTPAARKAVFDVIGMDLGAAAVWADCVKGARPDAQGIFKYSIDKDKRYPECAVFETPDGMALMTSFASANWNSCPWKSACHTGYHGNYVPVQQPNYRDSAARVEFDAVNAINATASILRGAAAPAPFVLPSKAAALMLLAHYVGDLHQPLHAGILYIGADAQPYDPARQRGEQELPGDTISGNRIALEVNAKENLHRRWDNAIVDGAAVAARALEVAPTVGAASEWPLVWADEGVLRAREAYAGWSYTQTGPSRWSGRVADDAAYVAAMRKTQEQQIILAGARLAQLLNDIYR